MNITLNRSDLFRFERLVSKLIKTNEIPATISFTPCSDGLQFVAFSDNAVLTLTVPSIDVVEPFTIPWPTIKEFASTKRNDKIDVEVSGKSVALSWNVNGIPQQKTVPSLGLAGKRLPVKPDNTVAHSMTLFDALTDASRCVDSENTRYSLGSICLRGSKAQILSTDGRQALIQDGFAFPWSNDVLCPVSKVFGAKELRDWSDTVQIGFETDWLYFRVGNVLIWLKQIEGKFPQLDQFTKNIDHFSWLNVDPVDSDFVAQRIDNLPGKADKESPVYVELNGHVSVRGHDLTRMSATELRLSRSRFEGKSFTMPLNRKFLGHALNFGINRIGFDPDERTPIVCYGSQKTFVIMPLEGDEPKVDPDKLTVLSSNVKGVVPQKSVKQVPMTKPCHRRATKTCKPKGKAMILDDAVKLRQNLRETLGGVNDLIRSIKSQRRQDKLLRDTVASLRKLQNV